MSVFVNLSEEKAKEMVDDLISKGYSEDDAFTEVYSIECNMDHFQHKYKVVVVKYGYVEVEADTEDEALEIAEGMVDSNFDWTEFDNAQIIEKID